MRMLNSLVHGCLQQEDPPFSRNLVERVIREYSDCFIMGLTDSECELLLKVSQQQNVSAEEELALLASSLSIYAYQDQGGIWFGINPVVTETEQFKSLQQKA